jgi:DNA-binding transcriptional ArsR family regulator
MTSALDKLKEAAKLREDADNKAKVIESGLLEDLKGDLVKAEDAVKKLKTEIKRLTPKEPTKKTVFKLSEEKANEYLTFIGNGEKQQSEIQKHFDKANVSSALKYLSEAGKVKLARKEGKKKIWKKA